MAAYYNEIDPFAAQWLRNLIGAGHIAHGDVDDRSIKDVHPSDLIGYTQCHFFAGIGVWSYALRSAGWCDDEPVWTGSCPCQPFSAAGKQEGTTDPRHLWPEWFRLIREHRPSVVFGEQVSAAIRHGWLDLVSADLEGIDYAIGAAVMGAHSVGAPHIRQRLYFVAHPDAAGRGEQRSARLLDGERTAQRDDINRCGSDRELADDQARRWGEVDSVAGRRDEGICAQGRERFECGDGPRDMGDADDSRSQERRRGPEPELREEGRQAAQRPSGLPGSDGFWSACDWLPCIDGKARPVEPGTFPLAYGASARVGRLRAYGNAIVAPAAAEFVRAFMECRP